MSIAAEKMLLPRCDVRKKIYRCRAAMDISVLFLFFFLSFSVF
jgi:hypothetical protein